MTAKLFYVETTEKRRDTETVMRRLEGGDWKSASNGNSLVAYPTSRTDLKTSGTGDSLAEFDNYHRYCKMDGSRFSLWHVNHRAFKVFNKETKQDRKSARRLIEKAFPAVSYSENKHVMVKGEKSPYDGDIAYWSERNSKLYDGDTSKTLKRQNHRCGYCGLKTLSDEKVHLHHIDGNHNNWKHKNLLAIHEGCHDYTHMSKSES